MLDKAFFSPRSVAVIGAAREPHKLGYSALQNILQYGFQGRQGSMIQYRDYILSYSPYQMGFMKQRAEE